MQNTLLYSAALCNTLNCTSQRNLEHVDVSILNIIIWTCQNTQTNLNVYPWLIYAQYRAKRSWQRRVGAVIIHYAYASTDNAHLPRRIPIFYTHLNAQHVMQCKILGHCPKVVPLNFTLDSTLDIHLDFMSYVGHVSSLLC